MNKVYVKEGKSYTLNEVINAVKNILDLVNAKSDEHNPLRYPSTDVYWLLYDLIQYVNRNVQGEFSLLQTRKGVYRVTYTAEDKAKQRSNQKLKVEINRTARYLEELTGRRPVWGNKKIEEEEEE